ncbi:hypothetical protein QYS49_34320 [Marivirga salinae]|uniref:Nucleotidyl transferase AbiEii/AbiGii toxin family protein n=1 Tax=Marivirga salinarum TaxID=3059078 RepID=A0AA51RD62_9BACT|nr:hypothetical protein [Marivirga sp. BDSF4-3]WMN12693.1 hypothetical protein QYS49_34320 [Marivirga sp. BDSF4-3]
MSKSNQTYKELAVPHFTEVFDIIDGVMREFSVPYYMIGASAIALELLKDGIKPSRGTKDIDFAMMLSSMKEFEEISKALEQRGFRKAKAPWTYLYEKDDVVIDLLPFGEIQENDTEDFNKRNSDLHIIGFQEVLENPSRIPIEEKWVNIPPLPGMILLKLIAWSDRPEARENDLADILRIIEHYYDIEFDKIVAEHYDTLDTDDLDERTVASEVLGREARVYLNKSDRLKETIYTILKDNLTEVKLSSLVKHWARQSGEEVEYTFGLLKAFQRGLLKNEENSE